MLNHTNVMSNSIQYPTKLKCYSRGVLHRLGCDRVQQVDFLCVKYCNPYIKHSQYPAGVYYRLVEFDWNKNSIIKHSWLSSANWFCYSAGVCFWIHINTLTSSTSILLTITVNTSPLWHGTRTNVIHHESNRSRKYENEDL